MKVNLVVRLFDKTLPLPCASAHITVDVTHNSISYSTADLRPLSYSLDGSGAGLDWQRFGDEIFRACTTHSPQSVGRVWVGGEFEITWRKV